MFGSVSGASSRGWPCHSPLDSTRRTADFASHHPPRRVSASVSRRAIVVVILLLAAPCWAQDGGVYVYDRAALLLPSGAILTVDAGVALDGPVALERANELNRLRAADKAPSWLTVALSAVVAGVWVADRVRAWTRPTP